jgi:hypothetical protein
MLSAMNGGPQAATQWQEGSVAKSCVIAGQPLTFCKGGVIDETYCHDDGAAATYIVRQGTVMSRLTTGGALTPCRCTKLASGASSGATDIVVVNAHGFMAGDPIKINGAKDHVIDSIDYDTNTITLTVALDANQSAAAAVIGRGTLAGSEIGIGILIEDIELWNSVRAARMDIMSNNNIAIVGHFEKDRVLGDLATMRAYSGNKLSHLVFPHDH